MMTITRKGAQIGRENFRIYRAPEPGGQVYRATGYTRIGDTVMTTRLGTDSTGAPVSYQSQTREKDVAVQSLEGRSRPGRFSVVARTRGGESAREYVVSNGALLIDADVFLHFYFVAKAAIGREVGVIVPSATQQTQYRVEAGGTEPVEIAGVRVTGRKYSLVSADGLARHVWVDPQGRLLKVSIPEKQIVAVRDDPPR
jgi:hypothetical protein